MELIAELILSAIVGGVTAYWLLRERVLKLEINNISQKETISALKDSIDKLTGVVSKLEKSLVKLETKLEN